MLKPKQAAADSIESAKRVERQLDITGKQAKAAQDTADAAHRSIELIVLERHAAVGVEGIGDDSDIAVVGWRY
ncbi:MAG: hypothetical protein WB562_06035 [Candidatus Sulfotelmatobacter sp.]